MTLGKKAIRPFRDNAALQKILIINPISTKKIALTQSAHSIKALKMSAYFNI